MIDNNILNDKEFDIAWEEKFGSVDTDLKFNSIDEFNKWFDEVIDFDIVCNETVQSLLSKEYLNI